MRFTKHSSFVVSIEFDNTNVPHIPRDIIRMYSAIDKIPYDKDYIIYEPKYRFGYIESNIYQRSYKVLQIRKGPLPIIGFYNDSCVLNTTFFSLPIFMHERFGFSNKYIVLNDVLLRSHKCLPYVYIYKPYIQMIRLTIAFFEFTIAHETYYITAENDAAVRERLLEQL